MRSSAMKLVLIVSLTIATPLVGLADWMLTVVQPPEPFVRMGVSAMNDDYIAGSVLADGEQFGKVAIWDRTSDAPVIIEPAGVEPNRASLRAIFGNTYVSAMWGDRQGGRVRAISESGSGDRAAIWNGTPESLVILHPNSGYASSTIQTMSSAQQAGFGVTFSGRQEALVWSGTPDSVISLHPTEDPNRFSSRIDAMTESNQGGYIVRSSDRTKYLAAMWSGTAASRVDLHPSFAVRSQVTAMAGERQFGFMELNSSDSGSSIIQAAGWAGSAESVENLHDTVEHFFGSEFPKSRVNAVYDGADGVLVSGTIYNSVSGENRSVIWHQSPLTSNYGDTLTTPYSPPAPEPTPEPPVEPPMGAAPTVSVSRDSTLPIKGSTVTISSVTTGTPPLVFEWIALDDQPLPTPHTSNQLEIAIRDLTNFGLYQLRVSNAWGTAQSNVVEIPLDQPVQLTNLSGRGNSGVGEDTLIAGLVVNSPSLHGAEVLLRGAGPSLAAYGVQQFLANPRLELYNHEGQSVSTNEDWDDHGDVDILDLLTSDLGAFSFEKGSLDSAIHEVLEESVYSVQLRDSSNSTGIGLAEVYLVPDNHITAKHLVSS